MNFMDLIPVDLLPELGKLIGVDYLKVVPTTDLNATLAMALVVFASWRAGRVLLGAYIFGGITVLQLNLQAAGVAIPVELLSMSPYLITILVLVIISSDRNRAALNAPASLGRAFHASN